MLTGRQIAFILQINDLQRRVFGHEPLAQQRVGKRQSQKVRCSLGDYPNGFWRKNQKTVFLELLPLPSTIREVDYHAECLSAVTFRPDSPQRAGQLLEVESYGYRCIENNSS